MRKRTLTSRTGDTPYMIFRAKGLGDHRALVSDLSACPGFSGFYTFVGFTRGTAIKFKSVSKVYWKSKCEKEK